MTQVNMHEAKTRLSALVEAIENGTESEVIIARNGKPAARIVAARPSVRAAKRPIRLGIARGLFTVPDSIDRDNAEIERLVFGDAD
jgi:prevent-host-death family protein